MLDLLAVVDVKRYGGRAGVGPVALGPGANTRAGVHHSEGIMMKRRLAMAGGLGGVVVLSSGCSLAEISAVLQILRLLGII